MISGLMVVALVMTLGLLGVAMGGMLIACALTAARTRCSRSRQSRLDNSAMAS